MNVKWRRNFLFPIIIACIATAIVTAGTVWLIVNNNSMNMQYKTIDGMTCVVFEQGISCNWSEWDDN